LLFIVCNKMTYYSDAAIYIIRSGWDTYIGSAVNPLLRRNYHKCQIKKGTKNALYNGIRANGGEWSIEILCKFPCRDLHSLRIEEERWRSIIQPTLNSNRCYTGMSHDEYIRDYQRRNPDKMRANTKKWRTANPHYKKDYYEKNKDKLAQIQKEYIENNKEKVIALRRQRVDCPLCGCNVLKYNIKIHQKTKKCQKLRNN